MTNQDYKNFIENEVLKGFIFKEDEYNVDAQQHFELAPNDIVTLDVASYGKKVLTDLKALRAAKRSQVNVDEDTGEVTVNGQPEQTNSGGGSGEAAGGGSSQGAAPAAKMQPKERSGVVEFLKMLKANGSLEKLQGLDPATKKKMADEILKVITSQAAPAAPAAPAPAANGEVPLPPMPAAPAAPAAPAPAAPAAQKPPKGDPSMNESWLLKEAYIILTEMPNASNVSNDAGEPDRAKVNKAVAGMDATGKKTAAPPAPAPEAGKAAPAPAAAPAADPAAPAADPAAKAPEAPTPEAGKAAPAADPAAEKKDANDPTVGEMVADPKNANDPAVQHYNTLKKTYDGLAAVFGKQVNPGGTILGKVTKINPTIPQPLLEWLSRQLIRLVNQITSPMTVSHSTFLQPTTLLRRECQ